MIRGYFGGRPGEHRPFVHGRVSTGRVVRNVYFRVDTGADITVLSPRDAVSMALDLGSLPRSDTVGVGGTAATVVAPATITFGRQVFPIALRVLLPRQPNEEETFQTVPSLLGRDILSQFALYIEERRGLVLLLDAHEATALALR